MMNCGLFRHVYFARLPIPRSHTNFDSLGKSGFRA